MEKNEEEIVKKIKLVFEHRKNIRNGYTKSIFEYGRNIGIDTTYTPDGFYVGELGDVINVSADEDNNGNYPSFSIQKIKDMQAIVKIQEEKYLIGD